MKFVLTVLLINLIPIIPLANQIDRANIKYKGTDGYFFSMEIGDKILADLKTLKAKDDQIALLWQKIEFKIEQLKIRDENIKVTEQISSKWKLAFDREHDLRIKDYNIYEKKLKEKNTWYKSSIFTFICGIVVGGAMAVGIAFGINKAENTN